ncbi:MULTISPECIES: acetate kinase [unclassified Amycolatopsis]|uniref:acetate/propionate family kinase n=1 Tax=unclassified Amycolatopsis TaxID=2618356 RepID=UPI002874FDDB|nr:MULTISPECIES: acetate kinase [unclassified Amycolatopsis]MDS0135847.1 acetate kinase [Amycolatopsis sp. 505]MDS0149677.1 acetate kinase [Amycolatopsis sp. CM201R]
MGRMRVLTVNPGSGSLRLHVVEGDEVVDSAEIGRPPAEAADDVKAFVAGLAVAAVAHRLVHGGAELTEPTVVDGRVRAAIAAAKSLAPEHVPNTEALLEQLSELLPDVPHVVCPDTAFHCGLPEIARTYPLPARWRARWDLRRFGFHGLSFAWAVRRAAEVLDRPSGELNLLVAHLSGGCSVAAVAGRRSVDTSMGFTPLEGTMMAKRSGTVDPGMLLWLLREGHLDVAELEDGLYHHSGLLGLSGTSDDTRDLVRDSRAGDVKARFAMAVFEHRTRRELAAVAASLDRIDALVFTGDIGWDQPEVAEAVAGGLGVLGLRGGLSRNRERDAVISPPGARVPVLAVQSREELSLAAAAVSVL